MLEKYGSLFRMVRWQVNAGETPLGSQYWGYTGGWTMLGLTSISLLSSQKATIWSVWTTLAMASAADTRLG